MVMEMLGAGGLSPHPFTPPPQGGGGAGSWCHILALLPGRPQWGCPLLCPPGTTPQQGASHLGTGGTALSGTAGLSSFTLRRRTPGWWHVPKPGGFCSP